MSRVAYLAAALTLLALPACGSGAPTAPDTSPCVVNSTAEFNFSDSSATKQSYDVMFDGKKIFTLSPGETSQNHTVTAWVLHVVQFNTAGTTNAACPQELYTPSRCSTQNFSCKA